jgi:3-hydroxybutyryl-CoA dehydrogenase
MGREIKNIVVAGAGLMGSSIAQSFPEYQIKTTVYSNNSGDFARAKEIIGNCQKILVESGRITQETSNRVQESICFTTEQSCFAEADWILEAVPENITIKSELFGLISEIARPDAIISSNTSALSIDVLSQFVDRPERFCGTHFLNPPHIIPLVELVRGVKTHQETIDSLYDFLLTHKKEPVILKKDVKGFLSNRLQFALLREATHLVESGVASPEDIDRTLKYGNGLRYMCSGPFKIVDFGGVGVFDSVARYLYPDLNCEQRENHLLQELVSNGHNGISTYQGFYGYDEETARLEERSRDLQMLKVLQMSEMK